MLNSNLSSFQTGVNTIYNKCVSCGVTPTAKTPAAISTAIGTIKSSQVSIAISKVYNALIASGTTSLSISTTSGKYYFLNLQKNSGDLPSPNITASSGCTIITQIKYSNGWNATCLLFKATATTSKFSMTNVDFKTYTICVSLN